jgi:hypothetical protein
MKIVRYQTNDETVKYGWMLDDKIGEISSANIAGVKPKHLWQK